MTIWQVALNSEHSKWSLLFSILIFKSDQTRNVALLCSVPKVFRAGIKQQTEAKRPQELPLLGSKLIAFLPIHLEKHNLILIYRNVQKNWKSLNRPWSGGSSSWLCTEDTCSPPSGIVSPQSTLSTRPTLKNWT